MSPSPNSLPAATSEDGTLDVPRRSLSARAKTILHFQLRGMRQKEIAELLGMSQTRISVICTSQRYRDAFDDKIGEIDDEFLRLKPQAFRALSNGLCSRDEGTGLRAAEAWFKLHGYKGFGPQNTSGITINVSAEEVALTLMAKAAERSAA